MPILSKIDIVVLRSLLSRIALVVVVFFGLMALVESLNTHRFGILSAAGGVPLATFGIVLSALRSSLIALPITVLMGTIAGMLDLQGRHEMTIIKASGLSLWRVAWLPVAVVFALALGASLLSQTWAVSSNRALPDGGSSDVARQVWLEQSGASGRYILRAGEMRASTLTLTDVTIFEVDAGERPQIVAKSAVLKPGQWVLEDGVRYTANRQAQPFASMVVPTSMTQADLRVRARTSEMTLGELAAAAASNVTMPELRAMSLTGLYLTFSRPVMVLGAMLLALALTAGYRRRGNYGGPMLQGLVLGFTLFTLSEMAIRAGNAQVITPLAATAGPALVAVLVGLTALLFLEDGYA